MTETPVDTARPAAGPAKPIAGRFVGGSEGYFRLVWRRLRRSIIGTIGLPWWNVGGNHDLNFEAPDRQRSRETFKRVFGPNYYAFFYSQTLFLMLDDVDYLGTDKTKPHGEGVYEGRLDATQLEFVRNVLTHTPPDTLIVMVLHIPLRTYMDMPVHASSIAVLPYTCGGSVVSSSVDLRR